MEQNTGNSSQAEFQQEYRGYREYGQSYESDQGNCGQSYDSAGYDKAGYSGNTSKRLYRSNLNAMLFGICGGIGNYFNCDPTIVRLLFVLFGFFSAGTAFIAYVVCALVIPRSPFNE